MSEEQKERIDALARDMAAAYAITEEEAQRRIKVTLRGIENAPVYVSGLLASLRAVIEGRA